MSKRRAADLACCVEGVSCSSGEIKLSPHEFFFEPVAVGRHGRSADIRVPGTRFFKCLQLRFFGLANHKSLIYSAVAIDHRW
jgi:hypothetical protein